MSYDAWKCFDPNDRELDPDPDPIEDEECGPAYEVGDDGPDVGELD